MMIMRPPQQGQGCESVGGSLSPMASASVGFALCRRHVEQLAGSGDVVGAPAIGEETVVADAMEAAGQHVDEEAADELVDGERHHLGPLAPLGAVVLPLEGDAGVVEAR